MSQLELCPSANYERKAFELLYPKISDIFYDAPIESGVLLFQEINDKSSVYFLNTGMLFFQIRFRKNSQYLLLSPRYSKYLPEDFPLDPTKAGKGMIRIPLSAPQDILIYTSTLRAILNELTKRYQDFGCCSRYVACSDAKKCVHPDVKAALGCQYRHNLMSGKIFYGKNQNNLP